MDLGSKLEIASKIAAAYSCGCGGNVFSGAKHKSECELCDHVRRKNGSARQLERMRCVAGAETIKVEQCGGDRSMAKHNQTHSTQVHRVEVLGANGVQMRDADCMRIMTQQTQTSNVERRNVR
mmetsp:Transcript_12643/g.27583  ORF Transcript_12643/g.27583 Transcript_12643/m.27583 type:complete len:123 (-) Transcript_12643:183-551(-)